MYDINVSKEHKEYLRKIQTRKRLIRITQIFILAFMITLWEVAAVLKWIDPFIFSQPGRILKAFVTMASDGSLWLHIGITVWETIVGFVLGTLLGVAIAIILWWFEFVADVSEPYLVILNSLPKTALAPIIIVWLGNNMTSIIATAIMTSIVVTIMTVMSGFVSIDKEKIKLVKTFGGTKKQILLKIVLPGNVPNIINALKINIGLSFVGVIVGEFLVARAGLGYLIVYGSQIFKMDWVMLSVMILAVLAALLYNMIVFIEKGFLKWLE